MITRRNFVVLAGIGAMGLLNTAGCAAPAEEPPRDVSGEKEPLEEPSPIPQKEPVASSEPFSGEIIPGMLCVAEYATNTLAVVDARAGEVAGRIPVGRNPASVLAVGDAVFVGCTGAGEVTAVPMASPTAAAPIPVGHQILGLCRDEARGLIYAGDYFANSVHVIDVALQSLVGTMELSALGFSGRTDPPPCCTFEPGAGRRTVALALAPEGDLLYCANYGTFDVARVDLATGEEIEAFDGVVGPRQILVSADGAQLLLAGVGGEGEQQVSDLYVTAPRANACRRCRWASLSPAWLRPLTARRYGPLPATMGSWWPSTPTGTRRGVCLWAWASIRSYLLPTRRRCWLATASAAKCTWWMRRRWRC